MNDVRPILRYWGKAKPKMSYGPTWHPLAYHCPDGVPHARGDEPAMAEMIVLLNQCSPRMWG
jgi:hypothetical protein